MLKVHTICRIYLTFPFFLLAISAFNQQLVLVDQNISGLIDMSYSDEDNRIYFIDAHNKLYFPNLNKLVLVDNSTHSGQLLEGGLFLQDSKIKKITNKGLTETVELDKITGNQVRLCDKWLNLQDLTINGDSTKKLIDADCYDNKIYGIYTNKIWVLEDSKWKELYFPDFPKLDYKFIEIHEHLIVASTDHEVIIIDLLEYDFKIKHFDKSIGAILLDNFNGLWMLLKGRPYYLKLAEKEYTPEIEIRNVHLYGNSYPEEESYYIEKENTLVDVELLINSIPGSQHEYIIDPIDKSWKPLTNNRLSFLVEEGNYMIKIKSLSDGTILFEYTVNFKRRENNTLIYVIMSVLCLLSILSWLLIWKQNKDKDLLNSEIEILRNKHQLLSSKLQIAKLQVSPHFIFNSLNNIQGLIVSKKEMEARKQLRNMSLLMRKVLDFAEQDTIPVLEDAEFIEHYLELERINHNFSFSYTIDMDERLNEVAIPSMVTQIMVENSLIHGIKNIDRNGIINVKYQKEGGHVIIAVRDNGGAILNKKSNHQSKGISIIESRIAKYNGIYAINVVERDDQNYTEATLNLEIPK